MPVQKILIDDFVKMDKGTYLLLDVRSPAEYNHAHISNANSLPLFNDEERRLVGTAYKQQSKEEAIKIGLQYYGPKMVLMLETVEELFLQNHFSKKVPIIVHCWRGGMRSAGVAWLLDLYGFKVFTIIGGYKSYRNWVLKQFDYIYRFKVIGGYTGSGKTEVLQGLKQKGFSTIDLEGIAQHKGSAFGAIAGIKQPSQEQFENILAEELYKHKDEIIWIEDESQRIGDINMPLKLYHNKQASPIYFLDIPFEQRLYYIVEGYGKKDKTYLVNSIIRIKKRLGGLDTKNAISFLLEDDLKSCFAILLRYYDKFYLKGLNSRENIKDLQYTISCNGVLVAENISSLENILNSQK